MISVKVFGVLRDIVGKPVVEVEKDITSVNELLAYIETTYPKVKGLNSIMVAINSEYATEKQPIAPTDEIALIPPVSGG